MGGASITVADYAIFKEDTRDMVLISSTTVGLTGAWIINVDNFGLGYAAWNSTSWATYLYNINDGSTYGVSNPYYGLYLPTGDVLLMGIYYPLSANGFCYIPSNYGIIQNVAVPSGVVKNIAYDTLRGYIYVATDASMVYLYTTGYVLAGSFALEAGAATDLCYTLYDPYYDIYVVSDPFTGLLYIYDCDTQALITSFDFNPTSQLPYALISNGAGIIYVSVSNNADDNVIYPLQRVDGGGFVVSGGEFSGGITEVVQLAADNCLTAVQVEKVIGKIKQLCDCGCSGNITTDAPTPYDAFATLAGIVTLGGALILTLGGDSLLPI